MDQWKIRINDVYPAYISWEMFERIQAMLQDNYADYSRNKTRGVPRPGAALLHGITYCGECGHKLVVQYKKGPAYICNQMRQTHHTPVCPRPPGVCQNIPSDSVDQAVVQAFFQALAPVELDAYAHAMTTYTARAQTLDHARQQQLERLPPTDGGPATKQSWLDANSIVWILTTDWSPLSLSSVSGPSRPRGPLRGWAMGRCASVLERSRNKARSRRVHRASAARNTPSRG